MSEVVPVRLVRVWSSRAAKSAPEDAAIVGGNLTLPASTGNDGWEIWKEYPREEDKGKWHLHHVLAEADVVTMPGRCFDDAAYFLRLEREFVEAQFRERRSTYCPPWLQAKMVGEMEWPTNLDPVEAMPWPDTL